VIDYLPNPSQVIEIEGINPRIRKEQQKITRAPSADAPFSALVFKVVADVHGDLTYIRVYSGTLKRGTRVLNANNNKKENISRIFEMHAKNREPLEKVEAGQIVAVIGLRHSATGDTLCDPNEPIILERMTFPEPVISLSIEPNTSEDKKRLAEALVTIRREDPSFRTSFNDETGQTIIAGMGELHLEIVKNKLVRDMKIGVRVGTPRVSYRETILGSADNVRHKFVKQTGGRGQYGDAVINIRPMSGEEADELGLQFKNGIAFADKITGGAIPREFIGAVESGVRSAAGSGILAGFPLVNAYVELVDGSYHEVDSSPIAFEQAGSLAFRDACRIAKLTLLEPIMKVIITTPDEFFGAISGDLAGRRGQIVDSELRGVVRILHVEVPLAEMFGYTSILRGLSQGRASSTMEPSEYRAMPDRLRDEILTRM